MVASHECREQRQALHSGTYFVFHFAYSLQYCPEITINKYQKYTFVIWPTSVPSPTFPKCELYLVHPGMPHINVETHMRLGKTHFHSSQSVPQWRHHFFGSVSLCVFDILENGCQNIVLPVGGVNFLEAYETASNRSF